MKTLSYLLIFLLLSGQAGDRWIAFVPESQAGPDTDSSEGVEYPLTHREQDRLRTSLHKTPTLFAFKLKTAAFLTFAPEGKRRPKRSGSVLFVRLLCTSSCLCNVEIILIERSESHTGR